MKLRTSLATGLCVSSLALFGLGCELEEGAGDELIPEDALEEGDGS